MRFDPKIAAAAVCLMIAQWASGQTNQVSTNLSHRKPALPSEITLSDGTTYKSVALKRVEPDGLFVTYIPDQGGVGMAKLKFNSLPEFIQKQFDYSPVKAAAHEQKQKDSVIHWAGWQATEEEKASQIRQQRQTEDARLRAQNEAKDIQRAQAEARKKEAAAQREKAERAQTSRADAQALRDWWDYGASKANMLKK